MVATRSAAFCLQQYTRHKSTAVQSSTSEAYDPRQQQVDRAEVNQLARMMPDPEEDELFDDGMLSPTAIHRHTLREEILTGFGHPN